MYQFNLKFHIAITGKSDVNIKKSNHFNGVLISLKNEKNLVFLNFTFKEYMKKFNFKENFKRALQ